jgi:predicted nucleotidyltransferase
LIDFRIFGSKARSERHEYSDLDVFIEVETLDRDVKEKIFDVVWEVGFKHFIYISPLIFTKDEIENSPLKASPIVKNIVIAGIKV